MLVCTPIKLQVAHKLQLKALACFKSGLKSGTAEHHASGSADGMVQALVDMAAFCDTAIRTTEDGKCLFISLLYIT